MLMNIEDILFSQGMGMRRVCAGMVQRGLVQVRQKNAGQAQWRTVADTSASFDTDGLEFSVQGTAWQFHQKAYLMLHKPAGIECSQKPSAWPSVYTLLPTPLRERPVKGGKPGVQAIGRLDQDTTGLLLLSDDGAFIHRMSSPKKNLPKVYQIHTADSVTENQIERLLAGVVLDGEPKPVKAAHCRLHAAHHLEMAITSGKYHQVKRMLAAVGNRVERLHRSQIGNLHLPDNLPEGQWRWLTTDDMAKLQVGAG